MAAFALYIHAPEIKLADLLGSIRIMSFQPPAYSFGKTADSVMKSIFPGDTITF